MDTIATPRCHGFAELRQAFTSNQRREEASPRRQRCWARPWWSWPALAVSEKRGESVGCDWPIWTTCSCPHGNVPHSLLPANNRTPAPIPIRLSEKWLPLLALPSWILAAAAAAAAGRAAGRAPPAPRQQREALDSPALERCVEKSPFPLACGLSDTLSSTRVPCSLLLIRCCARPPSNRQVRPRFR